MMRNSFIFPLTPSSILFFRRKSGFSNLSATRFKVFCPVCPFLGKHWAHLTLYGHRPPSRGQRDSGQQIQQTGQVVRCKTKQRLTGDADSEHIPGPAPCGRPQHCRFACGWGFGLALGQTIGKDGLAVAFVGPHRADRENSAPDHLLGCFHLRGPRRVGHLHIDNQIRVVFRKDMDHIVKLGRSEFALLVNPRLGIGGTLMGSVAALFTLEADFRTAAVSLHETLVGGPSLDQRAVDAGMFVGYQPLPPKFRS